MQYVFFCCNVGRFRSGVGKETNELGVELVCIFNIYDMQRVSCFILKTLFEVSKLLSNMLLLDCLPILFYYTGFYFFLIHFCFSSRLFPLSFYKVALYYSSIRPIFTILL